MFWQMCANVGQTDGIIVFFLILNLGVLLKKYCPKFIFLFAALLEVGKRDQWLRKPQLTLGKPQV